jgi:hypothetical protein
VAFSMTIFFEIKVWVGLVYLIQSPCGHKKNGAAILKREICKTPNGDGATDPN